MDKRQRQSTPHSPVSEAKRTKQLARSKKTTYFFQPQNTLAFNPLRKPQTENIDESPDPVVSFDPRSPSKEQTEQKLPEPLITPLKSEKSGPEQQSSDDSFDGIRWRSNNSPRKCTDAKPMWSSPLRTESAPKSTSRSPSATATVLNELTDSVLSKYGLGLQNVLSQTPKIPRSQSDSLNATVDASIYLVRSKSFDPRNSKAAFNEPKEAPSSSLSSRLNTWIDKFDTGSGDTSERTSSSRAESVTTVSSAERKDQVEQKEEEDDPFSDDDTFLANLKVESFSQIANTAQSPAQDLQTSHVEMPVEIEEDPQQNNTFDETDPFSDDLDITSIEQNAQSQKPAFNATQSFLKEARQLESLRIASPFDEEDTVGAKLSFSRPEFVRYQIKSVLKSTYPSNNLTKKQVILTVLDDKKEECKLIVRGDSAELDLSPNDIIHIILTAPANPRLVDNTTNLLIWNPDILVSSTVVADQLFCPRKTVLTKRHSFPGEATMPLLVGNIVHEIFQACFISEIFTQEYMEELLDVELERRRLEIFTIGDVTEDLKTKIRQHFSFILNWFKTFFKRAPSDIPTNKHQQRIKFSVSEALDVEESVWSPMFGIKGIADVTLRANLEGENSTGQFLLPMEIKTSKQYLSHQAQAALYSLLFRDRYNVDISSFLLVYTLEEGLTKKHDISVPDLKSLINLRNRISMYLQPGRHELPDLMRLLQCDRCTIQSTCMTINKLVENGTPEHSGLNDGVYEELTEHLKGKQNYVDFLQYWDALLSKEEAFAARYNRHLWVLTSKERESEQGKALSRLVIVKSNDKDESSKEFIYTFIRADKGAHVPMDSTQISKYDKIMVSDEAGHFALAQGYVRNVNSDSITIATRRRIILTELKTDRFHRAGVLRPSQPSTQPKGDAVVFRIDKDEMYYGMGVARFNLVNLFLASGDSIRRRLIVDLEPPRYLASGAIQCEVDTDHFNVDQTRAFDKVFKTQDYCLILGMPGTGKTTVIAEMIRMLASSKKTVLLTSYTNSAVDNILLKLREFDVDFLRIGNPSRIHQDIRDHVPGSGSKKVETYKDFKDVYMKPFVVAATCLAIRDLAFNVRDHFDYCIVDEASQVSMPLCLGPIAFADKFILVGDHYQLPPIVTHPSPEVRRGLSKSLFQHLADSHPQSTVELTHQYRMCEDIMHLSNVLVYNNRLKCGSEKVANQVLHIPNKELIQGKVNTPMTSDSLWMNHIFEDKNKVLFLNHDKLPGLERKVGENVSNVTEVELVRQLVEALCSCGVDESQIGVMTLYRSQLKLLTESLHDRPGLEILTADRFQGRDKACIIISLVRSNTEQRVGDLLKDWRRINVAVTRARSKLILLGSMSTLSRADTIREFIDLIERKKWIFDLPSNAAEVYNFPKTIRSSQVARKATVNKLGSKVLGRHPLVRDILVDMNVNKA